MFRLRIVALIAFLFCAGTIAVGQPSIGSGGGTREPRPKTTGGRIVSEAPKQARKPTPTTGVLSVVAEPNAKLLVEPVNGGSEAKRGTVPADEGGFVFNGLKPRVKYRVAGVLAGYHEEEVEVTIEANTTKQVTLNFKPILYSIDIRTNVENAELKYSAKGQAENKVLEIHNKSAHLELRPGSYTAEVSADFGYETLRQDFEVKESSTWNFELKRINFSEDTYAPRWTDAGLKEWEMPASWQASGGLLLVKGQGVGLPKATGRRFYKDFKVETTVKLNKPVSVSLALRAQDAQNYYLLQVTGEKSDEPYTFRLFVVKNGTARRVEGLSVARSFLSAMSSGEFFVVSVKVVDFVITVGIEDTRTGAKRELGALSDPDRTFAYGAVGIVAGGEEENVFERFIVCATKSCLSN